MVLQRAMLGWLIRILLALRSVFELRASREAEIFVLRQQLLVLNRRGRKPVRLRNIDRLVLVWLYRLFLSVDKDAPNSRRSMKVGGIVALPILGGPHHHYARIWILTMDSRTDSQRKRSTLHRIELRQSCDVVR